MNLPPILDLKSILVILFKFVKREISFQLIQEGLKKNEITIEIFELSILQDEEISVMLLDDLVNEDNVKKHYIEIALTKKYFKLA